MKRDTIIGVGLQTYDADTGNPVVLVSFLNTNFTVNKTAISGSTGSEPSVLANHILWWIILTYTHVYDG